MVTAAAGMRSEMAVGVTAGVTVVVALAPVTARAAAVTELETEVE